MLYQLVPSACKIREVGFSLIFSSNEMLVKKGVCLIACLSEGDDPRKPNNGTLHDFQEILVIAIAAMLSDYDIVEDVVYWARAKEEWLRRFLVLKNGIPSEDTFLRVFRILDPKSFELAFRRWVVGALRDTLAVDGKLARGSATGGASVIHMVNTFATELGVVLRQEKVCSKSNEITAIPELLDALYLRGFLVSIDAMGCQKRIAQQITANGGDYLLTVKDNQPSLLTAIETAFMSSHETDGVDRQRHAERSHGRLVDQVAEGLPAKGTVDLADWPKCKTIGRIDSMRVVGGLESDPVQRYYISSRDLNATEPCPLEYRESSSLGAQCDVLRGWKIAARRQLPSERLVAQKNRLQPHSPRLPWHDQSQRASTAPKCCLVQSHRINMLGLTRL